MEPRNTITPRRGGALVHALMLLALLPAFAQAQIAIQPLTVPDGVAGRFYSVTFTALPPGPYTWSIPPPGQPPPGLILNPLTGVLSGTPTAQGVFNFTVTATEASSGASGFRNYSLTVGPPLSIVTTSPLPAADQGVAYSTTLVGSGGIPSGYQWTWSGNLPPGLSLAAGTGVISGTPTAAGTYNFLVSLSDGGGSVDRNFSLTVNPPPLSVVTSSPLPSATRGIQYFISLQATGGVPGNGYLWSVAGGSPPPGMTLAANGTFSGTPTESGAFNFVARVTDSVGSTAQRDFAITVLEPLTITTSSPLPAAAVGSLYSQALAATGGSPPYTWLAIGSLPAGLTLGSNGVLSGTPTAAGTFSFQVEVLDASQRQDSRVFSLTVEPPPALAITTTSPLRTGVVNEFFRARFSASGGITPYVWTLTGGAFPPGLVFSQEGTLEGRPTLVGDYTFELTVRDAQSTEVSREFAVTIAPVLSIVTTSPLPDGAVGTLYQAPLQAEGGEPPYQWSRLPGGGPLPPGMFLNTQGVITGTPTETGTFNFGIQVTDRGSRRASREFVLTVRPAGPILTITTASPLPNADLGAAYALNLAAANGDPPYVWSLAEGSGPLPPGMSLSPQGALSGTPTAAGTYDFVVRVTDAGEDAAVKAFQLTVVRPPLAVTTTSPLPDGILNELYVQMLSAAGGVPPYAWSLASGNLPPGLALGPAGEINGTPAQAGVFQFALRVDDSAGGTAEREFQITVTPPPLVILTGADLPNGQTGSAYDQALEAQGGQPPYSWQVTAGTLPEGLTLSPAGALAGTPTTVGSFVFTVSISDAAQGAAQRQFTLEITAAPLPPPAFSGLPPQTDPRQQHSLGIALAAPYPTALTGVARMTFTSDTTPAVDNPEVRFANGERTAAFTVPAGETAASFAGDAAIGVQTGSVAGRIVITLQFLSGEADVTPAPAPSWEIIVRRTAPQITSVTATRTANSLTVVINGISSPRDMSQAVFRLTPRPGASLQTSELTVNVAAAFTTWYQSTQSAGFGSGFLYTQPFTVQGDSAAVQSVTVRLTNSAGSVEAPAATVTGP